MFIDYVFSFICYLPKLYSGSAVQIQNEVNFDVILK